MAGDGIQCWLQDLSSDLRLEEVLDKTLENALRARPGLDFAVLMMVEEQLTVVRTSALGPGGRRRLERWVRASSPTPVDQVATRLGFAQLLTLPLQFKQRSLGAVVALAHEGRSIDDEDREVLKAFSEQAAIALANAHLFQTLLENATQDSLTELPNRAEFERLFTRELERSGRYGEIFSIAILDLDKFKQHNDAHGHAEGDSLLRQAARTIEEACRASDVAGRLGGDEFALLLPETNQFEAAALCERLRAEIELLADDVSLSWGVAEYPTHGVAASRLLRAPPTRRRTPRSPS
jgi:diguanylate cyclase (GGDEF)-like protein